MMRQVVHMRDQKANQTAMHSREFWQSAIDLIEEITLIVVLWGIYLLATGS